VPESLAKFSKEVDLRPVILSGGSGTRLWPMSREAYPKQFCEFFDSSFLENTWDRLKPFGEPMIVTLASMGDLTRKTLGRKGLRQEELILEPMGKNTAAAIALICHILSCRGAADEVVGVFPADHIITNLEKFKQAIALAEKAAQDGLVVTLGIQPRFASSGFGYIETMDKAVHKSSELNVFKVKSFREKPSVAVAQTYVSSGRHFWNSGIFIFRVSDMVGHLQKHLPEAWERIQRIKPDFSNIKINYANLESISVDHGVAEKIDSLACIPCEFGWSDVGSWDEISRLSEDVNLARMDSKANVFRVNSTSSFVYSRTGKTVGMVDAEDLILVDTSDALLVVKKGRTEKVKDLVKLIKDAGSSVANEHPFEERPWGRFEVLRDEDLFKVKKISVDPGHQLSYQSHERRSEQWVIVSGHAEVVLNDEIHSLKPGQSINVPSSAKHRIRNPGADTLVFIEVQTGQYFGEDDIKRYADDYCRV